MLSRRPGCQSQIRRLRMAVFRLGFITCLRALTQTRCVFLLDCVPLRLAILNLVGVHPRASTETIYSPWNS